VLPGGILLAFAMFSLFGSCGRDTTDRTDATPPSSRSGEALYRQSCSSCHGVDLRGTNEGPSQLSVVYEPNHHPDDSFRGAIAQGVSAHHWNFGDMEPIIGLSATEVDAIIQYVRDRQTEDGFEPYPPPES
jgi:mono/diheme cytochrome c family protein